MRVTNVTRSEAITGGASLNRDVTPFYWSVKLNEGNYVDVGPWNSSMLGASPAHATTGESDFNIEDALALRPIIPRDGVYAVSVMVRVSVASGGDTLLPTVRVGLYFTSPDVFASDGSLGFDELVLTGSSDGSAELIGVAKVASVGEPMPAGALVYAVAFNDTDRTVTFRIDRLEVTYVATIGALWYKGGGGET